MAEEKETIELKLTKQQVLSNTCYVLPYNGSEANYAPKVIWQKQWVGIENLYDLLSSSVSQTNGNLDSLWSSLNANKSADSLLSGRVAVLESYFDSNMAKYAVSDGLGNVISETYATKEEVQDVVDGSPYAKKEYVAGMEVCGEFADGEVTLSLYKPEAIQPAEEAQAEQISNSGFNVINN